MPDPASLPAPLQAILGHGSVVLFESMAQGGFPALTDIDISAMTVVSEQRWVIAILLVVSTGSPAVLPCPPPPHTQTQTQRETHSPVYERRSRTPVCSTFHPPDVLLLCCCLCVWGGGGQVSAEGVQAMAALGHLLLARPLPCLEEIRLGDRGWNDQAERGVVELLNVSRTARLTCCGLKLVVVLLLLLLLPAHSSACPPRLLTWQVLVGRGFGLAPVLPGLRAVVSHYPMGARAIVGMAQVGTQAASIIHHP